MLGGDTPGRLTPAAHRASMAADIPVRTPLPRSARALPDGAPAASGWKVMRSAPNFPPALHRAWHTPRAPVQGPPLTRPREWGFGA